MKANYNCCKYCESSTFTPLNATKDYSSIEISVSNWGMLRCRAFNIDGNGIGQDIANIKYCPMCGRKLR